MPVIWTSDEVYELVEYNDEADLEQSILDVRDSLFGPNRLYLDVKKVIGPKGGQRNIPDGYLIDLNGRKPQLYVVENELASHDPLRHIAVQILQFSLAFKSEKRTVRKIVFDAIHDDPSAKTQCEEFARSNRFRNLDHLIDEMVFESKFVALVIIDLVPPSLEKILAEEFNFGVEVLALSRYESSSGKRFYHFEPFLADIPTESVSSDTPIRLETDAIDTVVVPARQDGFERTFLSEDCWYAVRIHGTVRPQIQYVAAYQVSPISAITHIAPVKSIEPYGDEGKSIIYFDEPAREVGPISMVKGGKVKTFQNLRYTTVDRLLNARNLDEVFYES